MWLFSSIIVPGGGGGGGGVTKIILDIKTNSCSPVDTDFLVRVVHYIEGFGLLK